MSEEAMPDIESELLDKIADVLLVLSEVSSGLFRRLSTDLPAEHPVGALYQGVNEMIEALEREKQSNAAYQRELEEKLQTIERQRSSIRELSTPIIEIWDRILCLPIVGVMDTTRSGEMTDALLKAVVDRAARCAIIDITGIDIMDTGTADHFVRMAKSVKLLGADCVLTGINPHIARTLVQMDVQLTGITTYRSLRTALQRYVSKAEILKLAQARMVIQIREELDVFEARRTARQLAVECGFDLQAREELAIAVSELASNIVKYGISGDISFERVRAERWGNGVRVVARDVGPPIANLALAVRDGYSDTGPIDP